MKKYLKNFNATENLIQFSIEDKTVKKVIDFYNEAPFPNYENDDDKIFYKFQRSKKI